jgi:hypothetical protein
MKVLIAIVNCHSRYAYANAQRETWIPEIPEGVDYKFFLGRGGQRESKSDEVFLDCGDGYTSLPEKVQAIIRWAKEHGYEFILKCDDDVILLPVEWLASGFDQHDFTGWANVHNREWSSPWGFCYTLSKWAMDIIIDSTLPDHYNDEGWVSQNLLRQGGIRLHSDVRYCLHGGLKENFALQLKRPLRKVKWVGTQSRFPEVPGAFAWAMYIEWLGYRKCPDELNIKEMKRVYARERGLEFEE